jgi:hypothetical protein
MKETGKFINLLIIFVMMISCSEIIQENDIIGEWKVVKVERLEDNYIAPDMGVEFTFKVDSVLESVNDDYGISRANWWLRNNEIYIGQIAGDTSLWDIKEITESKLILVSDLGEGNLELTLIRK